MCAAVQNDDKERFRKPSTMALAQAKSMAAQREKILVRHDFVTLAEVDSPAPGSRPPLARLVSTRGRGAEVALKTYLVLLWRCSGHPYMTEVSARQIAVLLDLEDPNGAGRRRVAAALQTLKRLDLVRVDARRGTTSAVFLLHESGSGVDYTPPTGRPGNRYFPVPATLFTGGIIHNLQAPGLAMLLLLLSAERGKPRVKVWWSVSRWEKEITLTRSTRAAGTRRLSDLGLVKVGRGLVENPKALSGERVRNTYRLTTKVHPAKKTAMTAGKRTTLKTPGVKKQPVAKP